MSALASSYLGFCFDLKLHNISASPLAQQQGFQFLLNWRKIGVVLDARMHLTYNPLSKP